MIHACYNTILSAAGSHKAETVDNTIFVIIIKSIPHEDNNEKHDKDGYERLH